MSAGRKTNYRFEEVVATYAGVPITAFEQGDSIVVERSEDEVTMTVGTHGEVTYNYKTVPGGTITITLQGGSASNNFLNSQRILQRTLATGEPPFTINDLKGFKLAVAHEAAIMKDPSWTAGMEQGPVEWQFLCAHLDITQGGSF